MPVDFTALDGEALLKALEKQCATTGASDIHFSPEKEGVRLEWRLHGVLEKLADVTAAQYESVVRRVKFLSHLKLNITTLPQDGQYTFSIETRTVNVRVATLPTRFGEKLTLRLLDPERGIVSLDKLGFPEDIHAKLREMIQLPHGLILVTGPTGSGKTTTLYALLSTIIGKERNIVTLEDPVEYEIKGIVQSQIDPSHDYNFATGLRAVLRHDPDVILVGEIRDLETAQTSIDAALTGHLVLSTLHTNSAIEAIPRLLSMGVSPYTFAPALRGILAQRLVRRLSDDCKKDGSTCDPAAHGTYGGVMALPELLTVTPALRDLILAQAQESEIEAQARKDGFKSMKEYGATLVHGKDTTAEEVARVTA